MTEFASIVERIERGEVSLSRMIYGPCDTSGLSVNMLRQLQRRAGLRGCLRVDSILFYSVLFIQLSIVRVTPTHMSGECLCY